VKKKNRKRGKTNPKEKRGDCSVQKRSTITGRGNFGARIKNTKKKTVTTIWVKKAKRRRMKGKTDGLKEPISSVENGV